MNAIYHNICNANLLSSDFNVSDISRDRHDIYAIQAFVNHWVQTKTTGFIRLCHIDLMFLYPNEFQCPVSNMFVMSINFDFIWRRRSRLNPLRPRYVSSYLWLNDLSPVKRHAMIWINSHWLLDDRSEMIMPGLLPKFREIRLFYILHDGVIKWKHFPRYWPFVRGIHRSSVNSSHKGQWRGSLMFSLMSKQSWGW